jgi:hypothetical protein
MILTYVLFIFAGLISIYSSDIRRFIGILFTVPPNKLRAAWKQARLTSYRTELATLNIRHNNAYQLLLFALTEVGHMAGYGLLIAVIGLFLVARLQGKLTGIEAALVLTVYFSAILMFVAAALFKVFIELRRLRRYDERVAYLERKISELS